MCHSACQTRGSECWPGPLGRVRPRRWPGVGAVVAPKRWPGPEGSCGQGAAQRRPRLRVASFSPPPTSLAGSPCLRGLLYCPPEGRTAGITPMFLGDPRPLIQPGAGSAGRVESGRLGVKALSPLLSLEWLKLGFSESFPSPSPDRTQPPSQPLCRLCCQTSLWVGAAPICVWKGEVLGSQWGREIWLGKVQAQIFECSRPFSSLLALSYWEKSSALGRTGEHDSLCDVHWPYLMFSATSDEPNIEIQTALAMKMQFEDKLTSPSSCTENARFLLIFTDTN